MKLTTQENENQRLLSEAKAKADATILAAEAEAKANRVLAASLTPELIEKLKYEQWDGKLPGVITGSDGSVIVDVG
jgi:regulator of protease activity HflC (stomatin/prohibitin superfamily)